MPSTRRASMSPTSWHASQPAAHLPHVATSSPFSHSARAHSVNECPAGRRVIWDVSTTSTENLRRLLITSADEGQPRYMRVSVGKTTTSSAGGHGAYVAQRTVARSPHAVNRVLADLELKAFGGGEMRVDALEDGWSGPHVPHGTGRAEPSVPPHTQGQHLVASGS